MKKIVFPMKIKFLIVVLTLPCLCALVLFYTAIKLFKSDKQAYIFGHAQEKALQIEQAFKVLSVDMENIFISYLDDEQISPNHLRIMVHKYSIKNLLVKKNGIELYSYGSRELLNTGTEKSGISLQNNKNSTFLIFNFSKSINNLPYSFSVMLENTEFINLVKEMVNFDAYLMDQNGKILLTNFSESDRLPLNSIFKKDMQQLNQESVKAITLSKRINETEYLASITDIELNGTKFYLFLLQNEDLAFKAVKYFFFKALAILIIILSLTGLISIFLVRKLTLNLENLKVAAEELSKENYSVTVSTAGNDEISILADSFSKMRLNIQSLLSQIRKHNLELEQKVLERTQQLQETLLLQKAMVDNLQQGFFMFKSEGVTEPVFSKATEEMLPGFEPRKSLGEILSSDNEEVESINQFLGLMLTEELPFEDIKEMAPKSFVNPHQRSIYLDYHPVRDLNDKVDFVVVVATDKTDEIQALEKAKVDRNYVKAVIRLVKSKRQFLAFLESYLGQKNTFLENDNQLDQFKIYIHTLKGSAGLFHLIKLESFLHDTESEIETVVELSKQKIMEIFETIDLHLNDELEKFNVIFGFSDISNLVYYKEVDTKVIESLYKVPEIQNSRKIKHLFEQHLLFDPAVKLLPPLREEAQRLATQSGKKLAPISLKNFNQKLPPEFGEMLINFTHCIRNTIAHGLESPEIRLSKGKPEQGHIQISLEKTDYQTVLRYRDDGTGIDIAEFKRKLNIQSDDEQVILNHIFKEGVSTTEIIDSVSGRGVGMSALYNSIMNLNGSIKINNFPEVGIEFIITIPNIVNQEAA